MLPKSHLFDQLSINDNNIKIMDKHEWKTKPKVRQLDGSSIETANISSKIIKIDRKIEAFFNFNSKSNLFQNKNGNSYVMTYKRMRSKNKANKRSVDSALMMKGYQIDKNNKIKG